MDDFFAGIEGVVHVGANWGQERDYYAEKDLVVLWVEAIPSMYHRLSAHIQPTPKQTAIQGLVTDRSGDRTTFHVSSNDGASSSIYDLALHKEIWPEVHFTHDIELVSTTLDDLMADNNVEVSRFQALVMDTQGSELLVLRGANRFLGEISLIKTEAADFESYEGCAMVDDLISYLEPFGFGLTVKQMVAARAAGGSYYELFFKKRVPVRTMPRLSGGTD